MDTFAVSGSCSRLGLRSGAIAFRGLSIQTSTLHLLAQIKKTAERIQDEFPTAQSVRETVQIKKLHCIFRKVGVNPRKVRPACERLIQMAHKRGALPSINNLVDVYNLISLRWKCSLGAHDMDRLSLPIQFRILEGTENFIPLGNVDRDSCNEGEFGYVDSENRLICRLDVRQAEFSKITPKTTNVLLIVGGTTVQRKTEMEEIFDEAIARISEVCGGDSQIVHFPEF